MRERPGSGRSLRRLASRLLDEQRAAWERGEPTPVEEYLRRHPELRADTEAVVDLIYQEALLRREKGGAFGLNDCVRRFPHYEAELRDQFDLEEVLESLPAGEPVPVTRDVGPSSGAVVTVELPADFPLIPGYEILGALAGGGMGVVYLAHDPALKRRVAIKVVRNGDFARKEELTRFRNEAEAIARLQHPNLAQIYEVGEHRGVPYLVLEYLEGGSLHQYLAGKPQPAQAAAGLVETLARAIHHAHERGIIHRDLKPANVLLRRKSEISHPNSESSQPSLSDFEPKISDFGLAKFREGGAGVTTPGAVLGTASYMPPEQVRGETDRVGPAADVYALGAILYELLTGRPPFQGTSATETMLLVLAEDPVPPRRLQPRVPRDLETICLKCLEKKPERRYASAQALAADLARFQAGEPIAARPAGAWERGAKWARRRPAVAALSAAVVAVTVFGFGAVSWQWREEEQARRHAEEARRVAERAQEQAEAARTREADERQRYQRVSLSLAVDRGLQFCEEGDVGRGLLHLARTLDWAGAEQDDWQHVLRTNLNAWAQSLCPLRECFPHKGCVLAAAWSPDGRFILTGCADRKALVWDAATGKPVGGPLAHPARVNAVAVSPDGSKLVTATGDPGSSTGAAWLWDRATRRLVGPPLEHPGAVWAVAFSPDGRTVVTGGGDSTNGQGAVRLWDASTGAPLGAPWPHRRPVRAVAVSPDGKTIVSGCEDRSARLWDAATGAFLREFKHKGYVQAVAFSPDGKIIATGSRDSTARLWDTGSGRPLGEPLRDAGYVEAVAFSPDGITLATGSRDAVVRLWDVSTRKPVAHSLPHQQQVTAVAFHPGGRTVLTASLDRSARLWELAPARAAAATFPHPNQVWAAAVSPDGRTVATGSSNGMAKLWSVTTGKLLGAPLPSGGPIQSLAFSPGGEAVVVGGDDRSARLWEVATGKPLGEPLDHPQAVAAVAFRPDGRAVLTGCRDGKARVWDLGTRELLAPAFRHAGPVCAVAFHPKNSNVVLTGCDDRSARLWDVTEGKCLRKLGPHQGPVRCVAFSPDGRRIVTGSEDRTARFWDATTGEPLGEPLIHQGAVLAVAFSPDGATVLTTSRDRNARLWDVASRKMLGTPMVHQGPVRAGAFHPEGRLVLTAGEDMTARLWAAPAAMTGDVEQIVARIQVLTGMELDAFGVAQVLDGPAWLGRQQSQMRHPAR
jgi:WD40 repeat protein/tRNA A-37 threonylcarbamoyl transferase component Bud32